MRTRPADWPEGPYNSNPTYTYRDNMTKIVGRHNLQFGGYFVAAQKNELSSVLLSGSLTFRRSLREHSCGGKPLELAIPSPTFCMGTSIAFLKAAIR